jgi:GntR family transcriptional regulator/MocR family aminotransferase
MLRPWKFEIQITPQSGKAVYLQIADAIIKAIQNGRLNSGELLPGSRNLSVLLKVNRNTIIEALNVLILEGWLISKERKGTFVSDVLPSFKINAAEVKNNPQDPAVETPSYTLVFDDGFPDSRIAPTSEIARAYRQIFSRKGKWQMMGYGDAMGGIEFRKAIAQMLNYQREMKLDEQKLCITRGSQMAMYLIGQCLFEYGDYVLVENPGYKPAWEAFEAGGAKLLPVDVDGSGLIITEVERYLKLGLKIKAIYTTPHHQYPTTVTLSLKRRIELIRLSNQYGFYIIEDDYDNEFHFGSRPVMPLSSHAELKNYIYVGTFSKVVAPALRIGYLASNDNNLIANVSSLRKIIDVQGDTIMEQAVLELIKDGTLKRHIRKATGIYKSRRDYTAGLLGKYLKGKAAFSIPDGGLAFWISPYKDVNWDVIISKLKKGGVSLAPPDHFSFNEPVNGARIGYASLTEEQLEQGLKALCDLL